MPNRVKLFKVVKYCIYIYKLARYTITCGICVLMFLVYRANWYMIFFNCFVHDLLDTKLLFTKVLLLRTCNFPHHMLSLFSHDSPNAIFSHPFSWDLLTMGLKTLEGTGWCPPVYKLVYNPVPLSLGSSERGLILPWYTPQVAIFPKMRKTWRFRGTNFQTNPGISVIFPKNPSYWTYWS